jgi:hypothetical protein
MADPPSIPDSVAERSLLQWLIHYIEVLVSYKWLILIISLLTATFSIIFSIITILLPPEKSPLPNLYTASSVSTGHSWHSLNGIRCWATSNQGDEEPGISGHVAGRLRILCRI